MEPIEKSLTIQAPPERVWAVLTEPAIVKRWLSDAHVEMRSEGRVGGSMTFSGEWHGHRLEDKGRLLAFEPPKRYAYAYWSSLAEVPDTEENYTHIRFELTPTPDGTVLSLHQARFTVFENRAHWNFYWNMALDRIRQLAETGAR